MTKNQRTIHGLTTAVVLALGVTSAQAAILIDFSANGGDVGQITSTGNFNNIFNSAIGANVNDIDGVSFDLIDDTSGLDSGVDLTLSGVGDIGWGDSGAGANYAGPFPTAISSQPVSAIGDGFFSYDDDGVNPQNSGVDLVFTGLSAGTSYDFTIYSVRGNNGTDAIFTPVLSGSDNGAQTISSVLNNNSQVVTITGTPTGSGAFTIRWSSTDHSRSVGSALNFMEVAVVPEPSTYALLSAGAALCVVMVRRRRR